MLHFGGGGDPPPPPPPPPPPTAALIAQEIAARVVEEVAMRVLVSVNSAVLLVEIAIFCVFRWAVEEPGRIVLVDRIAARVRISVPAARIIRSAAGHIRVCRIEPPVVAVVHATHGIIEARIAVSGIGRELLAIVGR